MLAAGVAGPVLTGLLAASAGTAAAAAPTVPAPSVPASATPAWPSPVPSAPIPAGTDDPSPASPGPAGDPLDPGGGEDPGFFDVGGKIRKAINDWFRNLVTFAASSLLDALGRTVLITRTRRPTCGFGTCGPPADRGAVA